MSKTDLIVGYGRFDAYQGETPPGTKIVRSGGEQVICAGRSTPAASGEDFSAGRTAPYEDSDRQESVPPSADLIKQIAMDIGKELVDYVERMYPDAIKATSSTFRLSLRNHVYNDIMEMVKITDEQRLIEWLDFRKKFRRHLKRMKKAKSAEDLDRIVKQAPLNPAMKW